LFSALDGGDWSADLQFADQYYAHISELCHLCYILREVTHFMQVL